ncbi:hypothetical protein NFI96_032056, partial [Prochilodus magdalenae]
PSSFIGSVQVFYQFVGKISTKEEREIPKHVFKHPNDSYSLLRAPISAMPQSTPLSLSSYLFAFLSLPRYLLSGLAPEPILKVARIRSVAPLGGQGCDEDGSGAGEWKNEVDWKKRWVFADNVGASGKVVKNEDCATRWGSKQAMIERILEQAQAIRQVLADERRSGISLTWQDTDVLQAINAALKPVSAFTDILSGENCVSGSSVLPILKLCSEDILAASDDDVPLTKAIKAGIMGKLEAKYKNDDV